MSVCVRTSAGKAAGAVAAEARICLQLTALLCAAIPGKAAGCMSATAQVVRKEARLVHACTTAETAKRSLMLICNSSSGDCRSFCLQ